MFPEWETLRKKTASSFQKNQIIIKLNGESEAFNHTSSLLHLTYYFNILGLYIALNCFFGLGLYMDLFLILRGLYIVQIILQRLKFDTRLSKKEESGLNGVRFQPILLSLISYILS